MPKELIEQLEQLGIILLTKWQTWRDEGREEHKFHCDLLLAPKAFVDVEAGVYQDRGFHEVRRFTVQHQDKWTKVHISLSWEFRDEPFEN